MLNATICTIGDEILIGQIVDTNSPVISKALGSLGITVREMVSIGDSREDIAQTLKDKLLRSDIVITTGGLGPTKDDITKSVLAEISGSKGYIVHNGQAEVISRLLKSRGLDVLDINRAQAMVPESCEVIVNRVGTAPVMAFCMDERQYGNKACLIAMPGVPFETENALPDVLEFIKKHFSTGKISHRNIMTYGIAESALSKKIEAWEKNLPPYIHLAYLPNILTGVKLRLSVYGEEHADNALDEQIAKLHDIIGENIYAEQEDSLEHVLGELLKASGATLAVAESCTGGEISHLITSVPGSSSYYLGSVTSYAVAIKERLLSVPSETIEKHGVVSKEVAASMAEGVRQLCGSDFSISTTGYSGPGGGDERWPEGTVWVGISSKNGTETKRFEYHNDRKRNIERFAASALHFLMCKIKKELSK